MCRSRSAGPVVPSRHRDRYVDPLPKEPNPKVGEGPVHRWPCPSTVTRGSLVSTAMDFWAEDLGAVTRNVVALKAARIPVEAAVGGHPRWSGQLLPSLRSPPCCGPCCHNPKMQLHCRQRLAK